MNGLALLLAAPALASMFGSRVERPPLLWVPQETFSDWEAPAAALERCKDLSFTLAATPELAGAARRALGPQIAAGRVELAMRLSGDPILPLVADRSAGLGWMRVTERTLEERERFRVAAGTTPAGFVPAAGALAPEALKALAPLGFSWIAAGPYAASTGPWASSGKALVVPLDDEEIVDQAQGPARPGDFERDLREIGAGGLRCPAWRKVAETTSEPVKKAQPSKWPTWTPGGLSAWTDSPQARRAWGLYGLAAAQLFEYRNSGSADLKALDAASEGLARAEASALYRAAGPEAPAREREQRAALLSVYRRLRSLPPEELFRAADGTSEDAPDGGPRVSRGENWLAFDAPAGSVSRAPEKERPLDDGRPAAVLWKIRRLRVAWTEAGIALVWTMDGLEPERPLLLETYIDLNARPRAGSVQLLEPKAGGVAAKDAWEYAVSVSPAGGWLLRSSALGSPVVAGRLTPTFDPASREVRVFVPGSLLRGNPERWGWVAAAFSPSKDDERQPPRAKIGASGAVLGLLAPVEKQKEAFLTSRPRLEALRVQ